MHVSHLLHPAGGNEKDAVPSRLCTPRSLPGWMLRINLFSPCSASELCFTKMNIKLPWAPCRQRADAPRVRHASTRPPTPRIGTTMQISGRCAEVVGVEHCLQAPQCTLWRHPQQLPLHSAPSEDGPRWGRANLLRLQPQIGTERRATQVAACVRDDAK